MKKSYSQKFLKEYYEFRFVNKEFYSLIYSSTPYVELNSTNFLDGFA